MSPGEEITLSSLGARDVVEPNREEFIWLASAIDFDGSIGLAKRPRKTSTGYIISPLVQFCNTKTILLDEVLRIYRILGISKIPTPYKRKDDNPNWAVAYNIVMAKHQDVIKVLEAIRPYLIAKTEQADIVLAFCKSRLGKHRKKRKESKEKGQFVTTYDGSELEYYERLKPLNKKGKRGPGRSIR